MTEDRKTLKSMLISMVLIIGFSAAMQVYLIKKKAIQVNRYEPTYDRKAEDPDAILLAGGGTIKGEVAAVSFDKFFLRVNDKVQPFLVGDLTMPQVGSTVSVSFVGGRPPTATLIVGPPETKQSKKEKSPGTPPLP